MTQAEALWAIKNSSPYPARAFDEAWNYALLYSEHTWGASMSVSDPENPRTKEQWEIKRGYALEAERRSKELMSVAAGLKDTGGSSDKSNDAVPVDVYNTSSSDRARLATIPKDLAGGRERVLDHAGNAVPSQRLSTGELVFFAKGIPAFAGHRFILASGAALGTDDARAEGLTLDNGTVHVEA